MRVIAQSPDPLARIHQDRQEGLSLEQSTESAALAMEGIERTLAAILAAEVAGYSRLMGADQQNYDGDRDHEPRN